MDCAPKNLYYTATSQYFPCQRLTVRVKASKLSVSSSKGLGFNVFLFQLYYLLFSFPALHLLLREWWLFVLEDPPNLGVSCSFCPWARGRTRPRCRRSGCSWPHLTRYSWQPLEEWLPWKQIFLIKIKIESFRCAVKMQSWLSFAIALLNQATHRVSNVLNLSVWDQQL